MKIKRPLTPGILNKIDQQLLKNSPVTWSSRIHLALYYGLAFAFLVALLSYIAPEDPRVGSTIYNWIILLGIISLLAFIFWMIYLLRFNVFKRFGKWNKTDTIKTFLLYFAITLLVISYPFIPPIFQSIKANAAYTNNELTQDINDMNIKLCQLEKNSLSTTFSKDTFEISRVSSVTLRNRGGDREGFVDRLADNYYLIDTASLNAKLADADSVRIVSDKVYIIYKCPDYNFIDNYSYRFSFFGNNWNENLRVMSSMDLYKAVFQKNDLMNFEQVKSELDKLLAKYRQPEDGYRGGPNYEYGPNEKLSQVEKIRHKYKLYERNFSIENITEKKFRWDKATIATCIRVAFYITLILALLVLIYRHTTRRSFFLSLLASVVLSILTGLFLATSVFFEGSFYTWVIIYFVLFAAISATIFNSRHRNVIAGIGLNLLVFLTPFMPLVITAAYYSALRRKYADNRNWERYEYLFANESRNYLIAEVGGFILLLVLLGTLYQMAYRKWYSAPEQ